VTEIESDVMVVSQEMEAADRDLAKVESSDTCRELVLVMPPMFASLLMVRSEDVRVVAAVMVDALMVDASIVPARGSVGEPFRVRVFEIVRVGTVMDVVAVKVSVLMEVDVRSGMEADLDTARVGEEIVSVEDREAAVMEEEDAEMEPLAIIF
jgi:hypothetical protein